MGNACVGENGFPGYREYAKGFSQAATTLIDLVLEERGVKYHIDELVYPVCFNMRHSVELRLKDAISKLQQLERRRGRSLQFDMSGSHDIGNIWKFFSERAVLIDDRYGQLVENLDKKIRDLADVDATGQTFRYPLDTESKKHLVDVGNINFFSLKHSFSKLEAGLDDLHSLCAFLCQEYSWGSFTKRLSRNNLFELASSLPPRSTWSDGSFPMTKDAAKEKFKIGSNELSEAIKIIESHFELAPKIDIFVPLLGIEKAEIFEFFSHWFKGNYLPSNRQLVENEVIAFDPENMLELMIRDAEIQKEVWSLVQPDMTPEILAGLSALYYFARDLDFSESYIRTYKRDLKEFQVSFSSSEQLVRTQYFQLFDKTNAVNNILLSLYFLRKSALADWLVAEYELDGKFSWLDDARDQALFRKPKYCGYDI